MGDTLPDVFQIETASLDTFVGGGKLATFNSIINNYSYWKNDAVGGAYTEETSGGKIYGLNCKVKIYTP